MPEQPVMSTLSSIMVVLQRAAASLVKETHRIAGATADQQICSKSTKTMRAAPISGSQVFRSCPIVPTSNSKQQWRGPQQTQQHQQRRHPHSSAALNMSAVRAQASADGGNSKTSVLFVCLGNICRSPTAEAMFRSVVERAGLADRFDIDSCGTGGGSSNWYQPGGFSYHEDDDADARMTAAAVKRGVKLTSKSRPLQPDDLTRFDYIIGMDPKNQRDILKASNYWAERDKGLPKLEQVRDKTSLMTRYCTRHKAADEVPDPYYGGPAGFERVLDLLEDASEGLLAHIQQEQQATSQR